MNIPPFIKSTAARIPCIAAEVGALLARLSIGQAFMLTGWGKLHNLERTGQFFESLGIPAPGAHALGIGVLELVGGALLILGLGVRPVSALLLATMTVAIMTAHHSEFIDALAVSPDKGVTDITPWMYGLVLLALLAHGAGSLSIDRWCCGKKTVVENKS